MTIESMRTPIEGPWSSCSIGKLRQPHGFSLFLNGKQNNLYSLCSVRVSWLIET